MTEKKEKIQEIKLNGNIQGKEDKNAKEKKEAMKKPKRIRKIIKWSIILIVVVIVSGIVAVTADRFLFPYLSTVPSLRNYEFLKPRETEIIIQEKETVKIEESDIINEAIKKLKPTIVTIIPKEDEDLSASKLYGDENYGSGFVITSDGLIVTNNQIINDINKEYEVFTSENKKYKSKEIYQDPSSEIIFIKIDADNLPVVSLGVSDDLRIGQKIVNMGRDFRDSQNFATLGVVSSLYSLTMRGLNEEQYDGMIVVDSEINSKNLGGALIDLSGRVYGINVKSSDNRSTNYVIPVDAIRKPMDDIIKNNIITRPKLGISYISLSPQISNASDLAKDYGLYLPEEEESVMTDGPAYEAGIRKGDLIYMIAGKEISEKQNLQKILEDYKVGEEVEVRYIRKSKEYAVSVKLGE